MREIYFALTIWWLIMKIFGLSKEEIHEAVKNGQITVAVYGLGSVGLPLAIAYALAGCKVIGVDIDERKVQLVNSGENPLPHEPGLEKLSELVQHGRLTATTDLIMAAKKADVMSIIVPVGIDGYGDPDLANLIAVSRAIGAGLSKGDTVILESTVPPGTTEAIVSRILEKESGLKAGIDFALAFSPERVKAGTVLEDFFRNYPRIVGGVNLKSTETVAHFYEAIIKNRVIKVSNARVAELAKLFKEVFRYINIALADEYALLCELLGVDVKEAIDAANTDPLAMIHRPGPGIGGHCIPIYPHFISYIFKLNGQDFRLFRVANEIDKYMAKHVIDTLFEALNEACKPIKGSKIVILGLTFRGNVKITYKTPAKPIIEYLKRLGATIVAHDPLLTVKEIIDEFDVQAEKDLEHALRNADALILVTDHDAYKRLTLHNLISVMKKPAVVIDTRNIFPLHQISELKEEIIYRGIGRSQQLFVKDPDIFERYREIIRKKYKVHI